MAGLLAGLLASTHGARVALVGDPMSAYRLARAIDLSVLPATRPETWALLAATRHEAIKVIGKIGGRAGFTRLDPLFVAETSSSAEAMAHVRHVAIGFGQAFEPVSDVPVVAGGVALRARDVVAIRRPRFEPLLEDWLVREGVTRHSARDASVTLRRDGSTLIEAGTQVVEAGHGVLADDEAIFDHIKVDAREPILVTQTTTALLTEPGKRRAAPVSIYLDRGVVLNQRASGAIFALSSGPPDTAPARIGSCLTGANVMRAAGQAVFRRVSTRDGAALIGPMRGGKATIIAGLGMSGAFLAPALARLLAGAARPEEAAYFKAHESGRSGARAGVADFSGVHAPEDAI